MGKNVANPTAMILSASLMLRHLGYVASAFVVALSPPSSSSSPDPYPIQPRLARQRDRDRCVRCDQRGSRPNRRHGRKRQDVRLHQGRPLKDRRLSRSIPPRCLQYLRPISHPSYPSRPPLGSLPQQSRELNDPDPLSISLSSSALFSFGSRSVGGVEDR
jgi:hypothetical protein